MKNYIFEKMSEIDSKYIEESINYRCNIGSRGALKRKMFLVAAIVTLIGCMAVAVPLMRTWDSGIDKGGYDFNSPEFEDFKIEGTTLVSYTGDETERLQIPEGIETIADYAFIENSNSKGIRFVSLSNTVKSIGMNAFAGCEHLESFEVDENSSEFIKENGLLMTANRETIIKFIGDDTVKSFNIPNGVKYISAHAFQLSNIEDITFPEGLLYIGYNAFAGLQLHEINLPDSMIELAEGAFASCYHAYEGSYPEGLKIGEGALQQTPFYMRAENGGIPTPQEDIYRYGLSISEAFRKSDSKRITEQLIQIFEYYRTGDLESLFGNSVYAAVHDAPELNEGTVIPADDEIDFSSLKVVEKSWDAGTQAEVIVPLEGDYDIAVGYFLYGVWEYHHWDEVWWRAETVRFIPKEAARNADEVYGDWYIEYSFNEEKNRYDSITFTNTDGRCFTEALYASDDKYNLTLSPDGEHFIVEYSGGGKWYFFVEDFTGDLHFGFMSYMTTSIPYYSKADGDYIPHTARWNTDPETCEKWQVIAENVQGTFMMDCSIEEMVVRNNTLSGEDTYSGYDLVYIESEADPTVNYDTETYDVIVQLEDKEALGIVSKPFAFDYPTAWTPDGYEILREDGILQSTKGRADFMTYSYIVNADPNFSLTYEYMISVRNEYGFFENTFNRVEVSGEHVREYSYMKKAEVINGREKTIYYVNILMTDGKVILMYFYAYRGDDGNVNSYFENVIAPVIKSCRPAKTLQVTGMTVTDSEKGIFDVEFLNEKSEEMIGSWNTGIVFSENSELNLDRDSAAKKWAENYIQYVKVVFENGTYYFSHGGRGPTLYTLADGLWTSYYD